MNSSPHRKTYPITGRNIMALSAVATLFVWVAVCFCSLLPLVLVMSLLFNTLVLGSGLFSALAQEREKRTIDALRLTQLSSLDILRYKSIGDLKAWKSINAMFLVLSGLAAWWTGSPLMWALVGSVALACGGLLSIALALAVSTRCDTTSSAVVSGWVSKGVWLVGLPILDYVLEAVLVLGRDLNFFSYIDPLWVYGNVVSSLIFETGTWSWIPTLLGAAASVVVAAVLLWRSSKLIDTSFESAATLEDRERHSIYGSKFAFGLHNNPFMVREMAWQMRTGAGSWPGYAVFLTLFLAPFFYGLAQQHKVEDRKPVRVVRENVTSTKIDATALQAQQMSVERTYTETGMCGTSEPLVEARYHDHLCVSQFLGLPVAKSGSMGCPPVGYYNELDNRIVVNEDGKAITVSSHQATEMHQTAVRPYSNKSMSSRTYFQKELDRGLLTGLLLTLLYLFIRGAAFMSGAVTSEKERRAWDQIALTGASPETYLSGKLAGVLYYPLKQLLFTSPVLLLFAYFGGISLFEILMIVPLLLASFLAAASLGLLSTTTQKTSHEAQGKALLAVTGLLLLPLMSCGWLLAGVFAFILSGKTALDAGERLLVACGTGFWVASVGVAASPLAGVMQACDYRGFGSYDAMSSAFPPSVSIVLGAVSMTAVAWGAYRLSVKSLDQGGSVKA